MSKDISHFLFQYGISRIHDKRLRETSLPPKKSKRKELSE